MKIQSIDKLQNKITELSNLLKIISEDLKDQKLDANANFEKYITYMEKEKNNCIDKYKSDMNNFIEARDKIFRKNLES